MNTERTSRPASINTSDRPNGQPLTALRLASILDCSALGTADGLERLFDLYAPQPPRTTLTEENEGRDVFI